MLLNQLFQPICGEDQFWDPYLSWNTTEPEFTECFQVTFLNGLPVALMILIILTHTWRAKKNTFDLGSWTFLKWARFTLIMFACISNIIYSSVLTQKFYTIQYRTLLVYSLVQLVKALNYVAFTMLYFKQRISVKSGLMWIFLLIETVFTSIIYHHKWINYHDEPFSEFVFYTFYLPVLVSLLVLFCFNEGYHLQSPPKAGKTRFEFKPCPKNQASFVNMIFFLWFTKLILLGRKKPLDLEDLWELQDDLQADNLSSKYDRAIMKMKTLRGAIWSHLKSRARRIIPCSKFDSSEDSDSNRKKINVVTLSLKLFAWKFTLAILLTFLTDVFTLSVPLLIKAFIGFIERGLEEPAWHGFLIAISLFVVNITMNLLQIQLKDCQQCLGLRMTATISAAIYKKALKKTQSSWRDFETGKLMNMVSVDTRRLLEFMEFFYVTFSAPFRFIVSIYLLYQTMGTSALYALTILLVWFPFNLSMIRLMKIVQAKKMEETDKRVKFVNEVLNGIKIVKLYAWEESFMEYIAKLRDSELKYLKTIAYIQASIILQGPLLPLIFSVLIFGSYLLTHDEPLTAQNIFFTLSIATTIQLPIQRFCTCIEKYTLAMVSCRRMNSFLNLRDPEPYISRNDDQKVAIRVEDATFSWKDGTIDEEDRKTSRNKSKNKNDAEESEALAMEWKRADLENITINIAQKSFTAVVGSVGSGKSSLLSSMLGEMNLIQGKINIDGASQIAFISQQPWMQHMSLRDNILFGKPYIKDKYDRVLAACALAEDIAILPDGDQTEIGENGINLSGGQKQRVSIARAVYSDADLYLFDDPLSAVDGPVARHLIDHVLSSKTGLLKDRTRVLVTNNLDILNEVDNIIMLENGSILETGTYQELLKSEGNLARLAHKLSLRSHEGDEEENNESQVETLPKLDEDELETKQGEAKKIIENEFLESGRIDWRVYKQYISKIPFKWLFISLFSAIVWFSLVIYVNIYLAIWADVAETEPNSQSRFGIFALITFIQGTVIIATMVGVNVAGIHSCRGLHKDLTGGILLSPLSFFEKTPIGRILNRFSRDMDVLDMWIRIVITVVVFSAIDFIAALFNIVIQAPLFLTALVPLAVVFVFFPRVYMAATRQLKRLESTTRSPIYSYIGESVSGTVTIRAYGVQSRFINEFFQRIDRNQNAAYLSVMSILWRQMILGTFASLLFLMVAIFGIIMKKHIGPGDIGLMLVAAQRVMESSIMTLDFAAELEVNIVCVERISEYSQLPIEGERFHGKAEPGPGWPNMGEIKFDHYSTRYRPDLDLVLSGIDCTIGQGEKIGIVGRTGAGKSTISLALFRILTPADGAILIDGFNICDLGLHTLRSRLAIIPQDPVIYCGTLRFNLDPFDKHTDDEIWACLELAHLKKYFEQTGAGLEFQASEGGKNLSLGQRQLICLTRALLKKSKVLVLDEATAAIDMETDALVQETIRSQFADCTILTIAHRLKTIMDSDRILCLDAGKIVEFDSPANLMKNEQSYFHGLAKEAGLLPPSRTPSPSNSSS